MKIRLGSRENCIEKDIRADKELANPIAGAFVMAAICVFGRLSFLAPLHLPDIVFNVIRYGVCLLLAIKALPFVKRQRRVWFVGLEIFFAIMYLFSYLRGYMLKENILVYTVTTLVVCIPCCVCAASIEHFEVLYRKLLRASFLISAITLFYMLNISDKYAYSMPASYMLQFVCLFHLNECFRKEQRCRWLYIVLAAVEAAAIFLRGARGPVLCLAVFIAIKTLSELPTNRYARIAAVAGVFAVLLFVFNMAPILSWVSKQLHNTNSYSRTFDYLLKKHMLSSSGREVFANRAIKLIAKNPLIGYGPSSDVLLLGGQYVHSLPLELVFDYGLFVGSLFFLWIVYLIIRVFFRPLDIHRELCHIFTINGFVMLFFSGTYLESEYLFIFIGLAIAYDERRIRDPEKEPSICEA